MRRDGNEADIVATPAGRPAARRLFPQTGVEQSPCEKFACEYRKHCRDSADTCALFRTWAANPSAAYKAFSVGRRADGSRAPQRIPSMQMRKWTAISIAAELRESGAA